VLSCTVSSRHTQDRISWRPFRRRFPSLFHRFLSITVRNKSKLEAMCIPWRCKLAPNSLTLTLTLYLLNPKSTHCDTVSNVHQAYYCAKLQVILIDGFLLSSGGARVFATRGKGAWCRPSKRQHPSSMNKLKINLR